jgi:hypothetical protein
MLGHARHRQREHFRFNPAIQYDAALERLCRAVIVADRRAKVQPLQND